MDDGGFQINGQLYDLLQERQAVEIEFETLRATCGRYFRAWNSGRFDESMRVPGYNYQQEIADGVVTGYHIDDPAVVRMKYFPVAAILTGGTRR